MRYVRIFLLHCQDAFAERSRSFVWFLIALVNPLILLLFWSGAMIQKSVDAIGWDLASIASYYFLLIIAGAFLSVHIEEKIAYTDIQEGFLSSYITRPFSYLVWNLCIELPYRLLQGTFGIGVFLLFVVFFGPLVSLVRDPLGIALAVVVIFLGFLISFFFKMLLGLSALWTTDFSGISQFVGVVSLIFGGFVIPLHLFPAIIKQLSFVLPFAYMFYFPIVVIQGAIPPAEVVRVIVIQLGWVMGLYIAYRFVWGRGVRMFTGVGL